MLARAGRRLDRSQPFVDARLPEGSRLHVVIPPITEQWAINIRKFVGLRAESLDELVALGSCSRRRGAVPRRRGARRTVRSSSPARSGPGRRRSSTASRPRSRRRERIVTCEEVFELRIARPDVVSMQCRQANLEGEGAVTLRDLVRESLRMRPDRIVVGEVRGAESLDMLLALNSGAAGHDVGARQLGPGGAAQADDASAPGGREPRPAIRRVDGRRVRGPRRVLPAVGAGRGRSRRSSPSRRRSATATSSTTGTVFAGVGSAICAGPGSCRAGSSGSRERGIDLMAVLR